MRAAKKAAVHIAPNRTRPLIGSGKRLSNVPRSISAIWLDYGADRPLLIRWIDEVGVAKRRGPGSRNSRFITFGPQIASDPQFSWIHLIGDLEGPAQAWRWEKWAALPVNRTGMRP